ncbi:MAG: aminotransferase class I/II-fold pyridoxal phosphate-dependent enzyme [Alphaproteobacteria bacterium]|nr:aminotransferase class I/II-fold pyridoxal phosphate-dependent enzyme [Alphaproteobacteria bacterium]
MKILASYSKVCSKLKDLSLYRKLAKGHKNKPCLDFTSNSYLSLNTYPKVIQNAQDYGAKFGTSGKSSRLLQTEQSIYLDLEKKIARDKKTESALLFNSGFQANVSVLEALLDKKTLGAKPYVFFDRANHASLYQGSQLAGAQIFRYHHLDMDHLRSLLETYASLDVPKFIITETVFGMDGDVADLSLITTLAKTYNAFLYVDEAHATGLFGKNGYGLSTDFHDNINLCMGSFSKALGSSGGYVACSKQLKEYLVNKCGGFIYSTAPSPMIIGACDAAWDLIPTLTSERTQIFEMANYLRKCLKTLSLDTGKSTSQIVPIIIGDENKVLSIQKRLQEKGIFVSAIRPPTVPPKTARLRVNINNSHNVSHIDTFVNELKSCL